MEWIFRITSERVGEDVYTVQTSWSFTRTVTEISKKDESSFRRLSSGYVFRSSSLAMQTYKLLVLARYDNEWKEKCREKRETYSSVL